MKLSPTLLFQETVNQTEKTVKKEKNRLKLKKSLKENLKQTCTFLRLPVKLEI